jgi:hypothetical protein
MLAPIRTANEEDDMKRAALAGAVAALAVVATLVTSASARDAQGFRQGRYMSPLAPADFTRYGGQMDPGFPHPWMITLRKGLWRTNEHPAWGGRYVLQGHVITFVVSYPADGVGSRQKLRWTYSQGALRFKIVSGVDGGDQAIYLAHPWRRLGP